MTDIRRLALPLREPLEASKRGAAVVLCNLKGMSNVLPAESPSRDQRSAKLRSLRLAQRFVLRLLLGACLGRPGKDVQIDTGPHGKPELVYRPGDWPLHFSLSHSGSWLAIALAARAPVGIDIEPADRRIEGLRLARRYFHPGEVAALAELPKPLRQRCFLRMWTAKEAVIKAQGATLASHLQSVIVSPDQPPALRAVPADWPAADQWTLVGFDDAFGLVMNLAAPVPLEGVDLFDLELPGG